MDPAALKDTYGDRASFWGTIGTQSTMPFGSVEDVRQEVDENIRILGEGGGYILGPCHNLQVVGPPENIVAMYERGYEVGWY